MVELPGAKPTETNGTPACGIVGIGKLRKLDAEIAKDLDGGDVMTARNHTGALSPAPTGLKCVRAIGEAWPTYEFVQWVLAQAKCP
jgi:hypothetical protein